MSVILFPTITAQLMPGLGFHIATIGMGCVEGQSQTDMGGCWEVTLYSSEALSTSHVC